MIKGCSGYVLYVIEDTFFQCYIVLLNIGPGSSASMNKSSTLPLPHRLNMERPASSVERRDRDRDREGYYSDRNELMRERDRERGYLSDHNATV